MILERIERMSDMSIEKIKPASDSKLPKALYRGSLPIGGVELDCFVLDDEKNTRVLLQSGVFAAFKRPRRGRRERDPVYGGIQLPSFIGGNNLLPFINQELVDGIQEIKFDDKGVVRTGYRDVALPRLCKLYIDARHVLTTRQQPLADMASILFGAFAEVGITALIDEATGFQYGREYNSLRVLLQMYLKDKADKWLKEFPDDFFFQLDRLYGNKKMIGGQRPLYYGKFINSYVYEPIEKGKINPELQRRYKANGKKYKKHQYLTDDVGKSQLRLQIRKTLGLMEVAPNMRWFQNKSMKQGQLSLFPDIDE